MGQMTRESEFNSQQRQRFSRFHSIATRPWGPPRLLFSRDMGYSSRGVMLTAHLHLAPEWCLHSTNPSFYKHNISCTHYKLKQGFTSSQPHTFLYTSWFGESSLLEAAAAEAPDPAAGPAWPPLLESALRRAAAFSELMVTISLGGHEPHRPPVNSADNEWLLLRLLNDTASTAQDI